MTDVNVPELVDPQFWRMPLEDRMARFADLCEIGLLLPASFENPMTGLTEAFWITTRYAEVVEISKRPEDFCSGRGDLLADQARRSPIREPHIGKVMAPPFILSLARVCAAQRMSAVSVSERECAD